MKKQHPDKDQLVTHFFRHNYGKMIAVLVNYFGLEQVEIAEDLVQDTLLEAMEKWSVHNIPDNPEAWLMDVAKKKAINFLKRQQLLRTKIIPSLNHEEAYTGLISFEDHIIKDSMLRMLFTCCHPSLSCTAQIALALKTLCGFSIPEIANALLSNEAAINKKLFRAKQKFRNHSIQYKLPTSEELPARLSNVCTAIYLLFNEGYYASKHTQLIRTDLCYEAIRLLKLTATHFPNDSEVNALLALLLLSFARFESRIDKDDALVILAQQDRSLWDKALIAEGLDYLLRSTKGEKVNSYQLQAGIAAEHCLAKDFTSTNWLSIYNQYQLLIQIVDTPVIRFNQAIAKFYAGKKQEAFQNLLSLQGESQLTSKAIYHATVGVFHIEMNQKFKAISWLEKALNLSKIQSEKIAILSRLEACNN